MYRRGRVTGGPLGGCPSHLVSGGTEALGLHPELLRTSQLVSEQSRGVSWWGVRFHPRDSAHFSRTEKNPVFVLRRKRKQSSGEDMMARLEGPEVDEAILKIVQDWDTEGSDGAARME